jgi:hypothetical protein
MYLLLKIIIKLRNIINLLEYYLDLKIRRKILNSNKLYIIMVYYNENKETIEIVKFYPDYLVYDSKRWIFPKYKIYNLKNILKELNILKNIRRNGLYYNLEYERSKYDKVILKSYKI